MGNMLLYLKAEILKNKRSPIYVFHIIVPLLGVLMYLMPCFFLKEPSGSKTSAFLGAVSVVFPILTGIISSMVSQQEEEAGDYHELLGVPSRIKPIGSKLVLIILLGAVTTIVFSLLFMGLFKVIFHETPYGAGFYALGSMLIVATNIIIYVFHMFLSFRFNGGVSIGAGILESLLAELLTTNLGENLWCFIPCAWSTRLSKMFIYQWQVNPMAVFTSGMFSYIMVATLAALILFLLWFSFWQGRKTEE